MKTYGRLHRTDRHEDHLLWANINGSASFWGTITTNVQDTTQSRLSPITTQIIYGYSENGLRVFKQVNGRTNYFLYNNTTPALEET